MSGRISRFSEVLLEVKMIEVIGSFVVRDFLELQNLMVMMFVWGKLSLEFRILVSQSIKVIIKIDRIIKNIIFQMLIEFQMLLIIFLENVVQIIIVMELWLIIFVFLFVVKFLIYLWVSWLRMNGVSNRRLILMKIELLIEMLFLVFIRVMINSGVMMMFIRFDVDVDMIVLVMFFLVIDVNVMEDWMVDGIKVRYKMLRYMLWEMNRVSGCRVKLRIGYRMKVNVKIVRCRCQFFRLLRVFCVDRCVLQRQNSNVMIMLVSELKILVKWLCVGKMIVMIIVEMMRRISGFIFFRCEVIFKVYWQYRFMIKLFFLIILCDFEFFNCVWLLLMCQYQVVEGFLQDWYLVYYGFCVAGGFGFIIVEVIVVFFEGRIFFNCVGIWNDEQCDKWKEIVEFFYSFNVLIGIQFGYAGCKVLIYLMLFGYVCGLVLLEEGGWEMIGFFVISYLGYIVLCEMSM